MSTFVKEDEQIGEDCPRTISYLQGYSCPKLYARNRVIRNLRRRSTGVGDFISPQNGNLRRQKLLRVFRFGDAKYIVC